MRPAIHVGATAAWRRGLAARATVLPTAMRGQDGVAPGLVVAGSFGPRLVARVRYG